MSQPIVWSGKTSSFHHKWNDTPNPEGAADPGVSKVWLLDAQWSDCPIEAYDQVKDLWKMYELGNDNYLIKTSIAELQEMHDTPEEYSVRRWVEASRSYEEGPVLTNAIIQYLREQGVGDTEKVIIHWWW